MKIDVNNTNTITLTSHESTAIYNSMWFSKDRRMLFNYFNYR